MPAARPAPRRVKTCPTCGAPFKPRCPTTAFCSRPCLWRSDRLRLGAKPPPDPTPAEIRERCRAIRQEWSEEERLRRLRYDWRVVPAGPLSGRLVV